MELIVIQERSFLYLFVLEILVFKLLGLNNRSDFLNR